MCIRDRFAYIDSRLLASTGIGCFGIGSHWHSPSLSLLFLLGSFPLLLSMKILFGFIQLLLLGRQLFAKELEVFFLLSEVRYVNPLDSFERLIKHLVLIFTPFHFEYSYL